ncbi:uncharacterized protein BXZ73DRAFT_42374, partial [Epithele typhae]|uniref:uncharacterized protein n=1 Tax=Epithele typhae TaxID=378194 RepID=UPI0020084519
PLHSSPSSAGSAAPPYTPDAYPPMSPYSSPYIQGTSASPTSPSHIARHPGQYDGQAAQTCQPQLQRSVIALASALGHPRGGLFVPQKTYKPHTLSDRRRYVEEVNLEAPIMFLTHGPHGCGIALEDAIKQRYSRLEGRDDPMFEGRGPSVSIRLNWPGYAPWSRQIPTRDFRSPPHPITRAKLAKNVAKTVKRFIEEMSTQKMEDAAEADWKVGGKHGIALEHLMLVGLQHVSMGSWQAHVRLIRSY